MARHGRVFKLLHGLDYTLEHIQGVSECAQQIQRNDCHDCKHLQPSIATASHFYFLCLHVGQGSSGLEAQDSRVLRGMVFIKIFVSLGYCSRTVYSETIHCRCQMFQNSG